MSAGRSRMRSPPPSSFRFPHVLVTRSLLHFVMVRFGFSVSPSVPQAVLFVSAKSTKSRPGPTTCRCNTSAPDPRAPCFVWGRGFMIPPFGGGCERPEGLRVWSAHWWLERGERRGCLRRLGEAAAGWLPAWLLPQSPSVTAPSEREPFGAGPAARRVTCWGTGAGGAAPAGAPEPDWSVHSGLATPPAAHRTGQTKVS